jgi:hypothetical protein
VSAPPQVRGFVAMVYVIPALAVVSKVRFGNSVPEGLNVIVWLAAARKITVPVPAFHDALVEAFVQDPLKFHVAVPKLKYPVAPMLTLPPIVFVPDAPAVIPPARFAASAAAVSVNVLLARIAPAFTLRVPETSTRPVWVTVPAAEIVRL